MSSTLIAVIKFIVFCFLVCVCFNATDLLRVVNFTSLLHLVNHLQQTCQFHQVATSLLIKIGLVGATCHLQTCYNLLKQRHAASLWITSFDNQLATSLLTTCNRLVVNKLSQAMRTHADIGFLITSLFQDVNNLVGTCKFLSVYDKLYSINGKLQLRTQNCHILSNFLLRY